MAERGRPLGALTAVLLITAGPSWAAGDARADLAEIVRVWRASPSHDPRHLRVLQELAARGPLAPSPAAAAATLVAGVAAPAVAAGRAWPLAGPIVARFGEPLGAVANHAIRIRAGAAAAVRAPARGRVVFGDRLGDVGLVLIIDHGDEYHSVLSGLGALEVMPGALVAAGQRVGRMGGDTPTSDLYLELRRNGHPIDPLPWLGVDVKGDGWR